MAKNKQKKKKEASHRKEVAIIIVLIVILAIVDIAFFLSSKLKISFQIPQDFPSESAKVTAIIEGDTIQLDNSQIVKLIGIESPKRDEEFAADSFNFLELLVLNKQVTLERDNQNKDTNGNLLRYVFVDLYGKNVFVNSESIAQGYSTPSPSETNKKYQKQLNEARQECLDSKLNLCGD